MENGVRTDLIEFLGCLGLPAKGLKEENSRLGGEIAGQDDVVKIFNNAVKNYSKEKKCPDAEVIFKGKQLSSKIQEDKKATLVILLFNQYNMAFGELKPEHELLIKNIGGALGLSERTLTQLLDFYFIDEPFVDRDDAVYLINNESVASHKHIGVNIYRYAEKHVTYVKYIRECGAVLTKKFRHIDREYNLFEQYVPEKCLYLHKRLLTGQIFHAFHLRK